MMDIFNMLGGMGQAEQRIGQQAGTTPQQTQAAMEAALPLLLGALTRNAAQPGGLDTLSGALDRHDGSALDAFSGGQVPDTQDGQKILGHVFGGQQGQAAQAVSQRAGINPQLAMQILSMLAPLVLAYLGRQRQGGGTGANTGQTGGQGGGPDLGSILGGLVGGGGLGSVLGGILGGGQQRAPAQPQSGSVLGGGSVLPGYPNAGAAQTSTPGGSGDLFGTLNRALDGDRDGNALNDLIGMFGGGRR
ncbi:DUF937 domain-containing protein [Deinococcus radiotolerans]|uniref:DUF937 domain-containing protein n=1 Tax=Deinococcus radiotolerans TaxID=1309407 RepID=A0ABQ2FFM0_9DEIO|nr:DUF937 domain-containing protein [Deinococcus radiotolerans]GGK93665.1 hypothetical protein GCM10010844_10200 [Deinococcus radiotolerans]